VDGYLAALPEESRASLERLRTAIRAVVPDAVEAISYGVPVFKHEGRPLVGFGAAANHCTFLVMSTGVFAAHAAELKGYRLGKGSIQFPPGTSLPVALVRRLVKARIEENRGHSGGAA